MRSRSSWCWSRTAPGSSPGCSRRSGRSVSTSRICGSSTSSAARWASRTSRSTPPVRTCSRGSSPNAGGGSRRPERPVSLQDAHQRAACPLRPRVPPPAEGITIAIDGPAGSGKSTVSRMVAEALDGGILDTGAMYRSVTWWCLDQGIDLTDREAVARAAEEIDLVQGTDPSGATVVVAGTDITAEIRTQRISQQVSAVATNTLVRAILQRRQRELFFAAAAERGFCVAEGRDITTVVAPDAHVRVLLTASDEERMRRRAAELDLEDNEDTRARMADQVLRRDRDDATVSEF